MDIGFATGPALGVIVPPANPTIEPELARIIPQAARLFATRLPVMPNTSLEERNRAYIGHYDAAVRSFGSLPLQAIVIGLTGPSYRFGPDADVALAARLSELAGTRVEIASGAIRWALGALGVKRLCLFSPYPAWLTDAAVSYWAAAGFEIPQVVKVSEQFRAYELTAQEVWTALGRVDQRNIDAVVLSGTGMLTLPSILGARRVGSIPLLSSNLCCAWWLMQAGAVKPGDVLRQACPELSAKLA